MESLISGTTLFNLSKTLNYSSELSKSRLSSHLPRTHLNQLFQDRFSSGRVRCICNGERSNEFVSIFSSNTLLRSFSATPPRPSPLACISSSAASFASSGGDGVSGGSGGGGGGGGDGDGGSDGGEIKSKSIVGESEEGLDLSPDVIILNVGGMTCGGCAASVKRILESQSQVSSASVNLASGTAIVWPVAEIQDTENWQQHLGETLAKHLTNCGFKSDFRGQGAIEGDIPA